MFPDMTTCTKARRSRVSCNVRCYTKDAVTDLRLNQELLPTFLPPVAKYVIIRVPNMFILKFNNVTCYFVKNVHVCTDEL